MILFLATAAVAYNPLGAQWSEQPAPYWIDADIPPQLDRDAAIAAARAGIEVWADADCGFSVSYQGEYSGGPPGLDGFSVIYIIGTDWPEAPNVLTAPIVGVSGNDIEEADLLLNAAYFEWTTEGDVGAPAFDVQGSVAHEAGHFVGLDEVELADQTMNPLLNGREAARTLGDDDIAGLCSLYLNPHQPGGEGDACLERDDCAEPLQCVSDDGRQYCTDDPVATRACGCATGSGFSSLWAALSAVVAGGRRSR